MSLVVTTGKRSGPRRYVLLAPVLWPLASITFGCFNGRASVTMLSTIPTMLIMEDLVSSGLTFKLDNKDRLHAGALAGGRTCVNALDGHAFRKEVELAHGIQISDSRFLIEEQTVRSLPERRRNLQSEVSNLQSEIRNQKSEMPVPLLEVCVETLPEALQAVAAGADRLEVCAALSESGTTPSIGLVEAILEHVKVPVFVMIRPRGGDFTYDDNDLDVMRRDIVAMRRAGAQGVASGVLESTGVIDRESTKSLLDAAAPLPFTFHRAFDLTPELEKALATLRALGVHRILTSGGASTALVGAGAIAKLRQQAGDTLTLMAGGGVRAAHVSELIEVSGVSEVHARPTRRRSKSSFPTRDIVFGATIPVPVRSELDPEGVKALVRELQVSG